MSRKLRSLDETAGVAGVAETRRGPVPAGQAAGAASGARNGRGRRFTGGIAQANELVRGMGLKPLKGPTGPKIAY